jgi:hypothetical protein
MTDRKFSVRFTCQGQATERIPLTPRLAAIATNLEAQPQHAILEAVTVHKAADVDANSAADCYLQIWELDFYQTSRYLENEETDLNAASNQLVASIPGTVVAVGAGDYRFRRCGDFDGEEVDPLRGKVALSLERVADGTSSDVVLRMPEYESVFELFAILRKTQGDSTVEQYREGTPFLVRNIEASLRQQIASRGGIATAFVVDFGANPPPNNAEFARQAEEMIPTLPTFIVEGGQVKMGYRLWSSYMQMSPRLTELRDAVRDLLVLEESPKVAVLELYGHGVRQKLLINQAGYNAAGSLRIDRVPEFVQQALPHLSNEPVIPLFACNTGAGPAPNPDNRYGHPLVGEDLGGDSLAWTLFHELVRQGIPDPTVWAHTTAAHTTRNPRLRVFSRYGVADYANVLFEQPELANATLNAYCQSVTPLDQYTAAQAVLYRQRLHGANLIRRISLQHAMYLPWDWTGLGSPTLDSDFSVDASREALALHRELRLLVAGDPQTLPDEMQFEDPPARAFITGLVEGQANATLSQNFSYAEVQGLAEPMRLSVRLLRALQLLRYRTGRGMAPESILDDGELIAVRVAPDTPAVRNQVLTEANNMVTQGLLTAAALEDDLVQLNLVDI